MTLPAGDNKEDYERFNARLSLAEKAAKGAKLTNMDKELVAKQELFNVTHDHSSSVWLEGPSRFPNEDEEDRFRNVYRPVGEAELAFLLQHSCLPDTQPYQAVIEGLNGRTYAEKFLRSNKFVDTLPCAVVEFRVPTETVRELFALQHKIEDGALSMGLGHAAGRGLSLFNAALQAAGSYRIVLVKRRGQK